MKKLLTRALIGLAILFAPTSAFAINITVPAAPGAGYILISTTTGSYNPVASTSLPSLVSSVFGRQGAVVAQSGDYNTSQVTESGNLYFTGARAIASLLTGYTSGAGTISASDSILTAIQKLNGNIGALVTGVSSFNTRTGAITLLSGDVTGALGFTPYNATNPSGYISNITGLVTAGTNVTIGGSGTSGSPYVINSTGGGSGSSPWATTTSSTVGQNIVYPNNTTDIVTIGGNSTTTAPVYFNPNNNQTYLNGNVGISTAPTAATLLNIATSTAASGSSLAIMSGTLTGSSATAALLGLNITCTINETVSNTVVANGGPCRNRYIATNSSAGLRVAELSSISTTFSNTGANASTTNAAGIESLNPNTSAGTLTDNYQALWIRGGAQGGTITNRYGLRIDAQTGGTNRWGISQEGSGDLNYFAGNVGIGSTTPAAPLSVVGDSFFAGKLTATSTATSTFTGPVQASCFTTNGTTCITPGTGTVTSVDMSVPTGLSIAGNPVTTSGTLALTYSAGYAGVLTASTTNWQSFYTTPSSRITAGTNLSWSGNTLNAISATTSPGGLNTQIQYNNAGVFGGITGATTDGTIVSLSGAHLLNPTINGAGAGLATLVYPNTASNATITVPATTGTLALLSDLTGYVTSVTGTSNRITSSGGTTPAIDIAATYVGQTSLTTVGTITTGVWNGTAIANANLANSTISGVALGSNLFAHTHDATFTGTSYNGSAAVSNWGIDLTHANTWTGGQTFGNATTTNFAITGITNSFLAADGTGRVIATSTPGAATITLSGDVSGSGTTAITTTIGALKVVGSMIANATIDLTTKVTGILPVANGGTGTTTFVAYAPVIGGTTSTGNLTSTASAGTSGQVLTSNGTSAAPSFQTAGGTGVVTLASGSLTGTTINITSIPATYSQIIVQFNGASFTTASHQVDIAVSTDNGATWDTTNGNYPIFKLTGITNSNTTGGQASLIDSAVMTAAQTSTGSVQITGYQGGMTPMAIASIRPNGVLYLTHSFYIGTTNAINALQIFSDGTGTFDAGTYAVYGVY